METDDSTQELAKDPPHVCARKSAVIQSVCTIKKHGRHLSLWNMSGTAGYIQMNYRVENVPKRTGGIVGLRRPNLCSQGLIY